MKNISKIKLKSNWLTKRSCFNRICKELMIKSTTAARPNLRKNVNLKKLTKKLLIIRKFQTKKMNTNKSVLKIEKMHFNKLQRFGNLNVRTF